VSGISTPTTLFGIPTRAEAGANTPNAVVLTGGAANVFGAWAQLIAAIASPVRYFLIGLGNPGSNNNRFQVQIGTGAGGAEVVLMQRTVFWPAALAVNAQVAFFTCPLRVATIGTRIAARCSDEVGAQTIEIYPVFLED